MQNQQNNLTHFKQFKIQLITDTVEEEKIDEEHWNHPLEEINATSSDESDTESGNLFLQSKLLDTYYGSSKYEQDHNCLYLSQIHRG